MTFNSVTDKNYVKLGQIYQILNLYSCNEKSIKWIESILDSGFDLDYKLTLQNPVCHYKPQYLGNTLLHIAADLNEVSLIDLLIERGANFTIKNNNGYTPLLITFDQYSEFDALLVAHLKKNNFANIHCKNGISHFHVACATKLVEVVKLFLKAGCSVDERVNDDSPEYPGYTPLHFAIEYKQIKIIKLLLSNGANINSKDIKGITPFHLIIEKCKKSVFQSDIIQTTLSSVNDYNLLPDHVGLTYLHVSCISDNTKLIDSFINKDIVIDSFIKFDSPMWPGYTPLHIASDFNKLSTVIHLLKKGANLLAKDANGTTPLDLCTKQYKLNEIIQIILTEKRHQLSEIKLTDGTCLLDVLHALRDSEEFKKFIKEKVLNLNTCIPLSSLLWPGYNLFHLQVKFCNYIDLTTLSSNHDFMMLDANGMSPLHLAFRLHKKEIIKTILNSYKNIPADSVDKDNLSHLFIACAAKHRTATKYFLCKGADPNLPLLNSIIGVDGFTPNPDVIKAGSTSLHIAIKSLVPDLIDLLLSFGANPNAVDVNGVTPFQTILEYYKSDDWWRSDIIMIFYHIFSCNIKIEMSRAMSLIILYNNSSIINTTILFKNLISNFFEEKHYEKLGLSKLQFACVTGDLSIVREEIEFGADVNQCIDSNSDVWPGDTALHIVFRKESYFKYEIAELLIEHGADPTVKNASGLTPIHLSKDGKLEMGILLLKNKFTNVNPANNEGLTHFHLCCMTSNVLVVKEFLKSGVNVNATVDNLVDCNAGYTPLHFAVKNGRTEIIELLIRHGADQYIKDTDGHMPFHLILSKKFQQNQIQDILKCSEIDFQAENRLKETVYEKAFKSLLSDDEHYELFEKTAFIDEITICLIVNNRLSISFKSFIANKLHSPKFIVNAACYLYPDIFEKLVNNIPDISSSDSNGLNALHHILDINCLLSRSDWQNKSNIDEITYNYFSNITMLVRNICELNHKDNEGKTVLHKILSVKKVFNNTAEKLLSLGADITIKDDRGKTPYDYLKESTSSELKYVNEAFSNYINKMRLIHYSNEFDTIDLPDFEIDEIIEEKSQLDVKLKQEVNSSISADYFFSEKFVIDFKRIPVLQRKAINNIMCYNSHLLFPKTYELIILQSGRIRTRSRLLEPATVALQSLVDLTIPQLCVDLILDYLSNNDLMNLVRAGNGKLIFAPLPKNC